MQFSGSDSEFNVQLGGLAWRDFHGGPSGLLTVDLIDLGRKLQIPEAYIVIHCRWEG